LSVWAHGVLTAGSCLPSVFGSAFSAADGSLYHVEGDDTKATISFGAAGVGLFTDAGVAKAAALGLSAAAKALKAGAAVKAGAAAVKVSAIVLAVGKDVSLTGKIGESTYATKLAEKLSGAAQRDVDNLLSQLKARNGNPGIGTRSLGNGFFELRARNGGSVIVRRTDESSFDIVGKFQGHVRGDDAISAIIKKLIDDYKP
jgi:hypothetical protein